MGKTYSPEETVRRAREAIGKKGYDALSNNCEHFARECKTGEHKADQSFDAIDILMLPYALPMAIAETAKERFFDKK